MNEDTVKETALAVRNDKLVKDFDRQRELFARFGYKNPGEHMLGHYAVVETPEGGYKMVRRETPVDFAFDNDGHARCVAAASRGYAERLGGLELHTSDRRVVDNILCQSVEAGEVAAWATM